MPGWNHPPFVKGATKHEQDVVNAVFHLADSLPDKRIVGPIREAVELIIELIESKSRRQVFDEHYDRSHEED